MRPEHVLLIVAAAVAAFPGEGHENCSCRCYPGRFAIVNERKIPFKRFKPKIKVTSQTKFNICTKDLPIGALAEFLDKYLPNKILVPANIATSTVTIRLKNKAFKQIINGSGLALKGSNFFIH
ncbi:MAG: hypothetical protein QOC23_08935 [Nitrososphaeraceae archaeon]|nr:hypothetical protein [Nitrososphaeraceae archaeon]